MDTGTGLPCNAAATKSPGKLYFSKMCNHSGTFGALGFSDQGRSEELGMIRIRVTEKMFWWEGAGKICGSVGGNEEDPRII